MRRTFLIRLFLLLIAVFAAMGIGTYVHLTRHAYERAEQMMSGRLKDISELLVHEDECEQSARELYEETALHRAHATAEMLRLRPESAARQEDLQELCNLMGAEQICLTDAAGLITAAVPADIVGTDIDDDEQRRDFAVCATDPSAELCRTLRPAKSETALLQYAGVHRLDTPGTVLMGFSTHRLHRTRSDEALTRLAEHYHMGEQGHIIAFNGGSLLNKGSINCNTAELLSVPLNRVDTLRADGVNYFTYAVENRRYRLVALLPTTEIYRAGMKTLRNLLLSNLLIFFIMFLAADFLLRRYVLRGLSGVINSLRRITDGDLTERVEIHSTPEFRRLSSDINAMVDTLRYYGEEEMTAMNRELELARNIQSAALPSQFPAFPNRTDFDLYAVCVPAASVGGDFYDFFMPDDDRLCFVVADLSESGIPAALYMMRCMSLIRAAVRSGMKPATLARHVNKSLCEGQASGIHLSLFYGCLRLRSGELRFINAGKPQAMLRRGDGLYKDLPMESGPAMGLFEEAEYRECRLTLQPDDRLVLWTEGVTEAADAENTPFGKKRLAEALNQPAVTVADIAHQTRAALRTFLKGNPIQTDVTILALEYRSGKRAKGELTLRAGETDGLDTLFDEQMEAVFAAPDDIEAMKTAAHALLSALPEEVEVHLQLKCEETLAELTVCYGGEKNAPLRALPPNLLSATEHSYSETEGNRLTLKKKLS